MYSVLYYTVVMICNFQPGGQHTVPVILHQVFMVELCDRHQYIRFLPLSAGFDILLWFSLLKASIASIHPPFAAVL